MNSKKEALNYSLICEGVIVGYKYFNVKNIHFHLKSGDIMGLIGRSGCGKSTLINALLGAQYNL